MEELRIKIYSMLQTDSQVNESGKLGNLLGKYATSPYGICSVFPKVEIVPPYIIFKNIVSVQDNKNSKDALVIDEHYDFISVGNNYQEVQDRIEKLFDKVLIDLPTNKMLKSSKDYESGNKWDDNLRVYVKKSSYIFKCLQTYTAI